MVGRFLKSERCSLYWNFEYIQFHYKVAYPTVCVCEILTFCKSISSLGCRPWCARELRRHTGNQHPHTWIVRYGLMCLWYHTNILFIPRTLFFQRPITEFNMRICLHLERLRKMGKLPQEAIYFYAIRGDCSNKLKRLNYNTYKHTF